MENNVRSKIARNKYYKENLLSQLLLKLCQTYYVNLYNHYSSKVREDGGKSHLITTIGSNYKNWLRQVWVTFVTKMFFFKMLRNRGWGHSSIQRLCRCAAEMPLFKPKPSCEILPKIDSGQNHSCRTPTYKNQRRNPLPGFETKCMQWLPFHMSHRFEL